MTQFLIDMAVFTVLAILVGAFLEATVNLIRFVIRDSEDTNENL